MAVGWRMVLTDAFYVPVGEVLNAKEREVNIALSRVDTASFSIRADNELADAIMTLEGHVKIYRDELLMYYGGLLTATEEGTDSGARISVTSAGPGWALQHRYPNKTSAPVLFGASTDRADIVASLIDGLHTQFAVYDIPDPSLRAIVLAGYPATVAISLYNGIGYVPIDVTTLPISSGSSVVYNIPPNKSMLDILTELSASSSGFEWRFLPFDNVDPTSNWLQLDSNFIAQMTAAPALGTDRPEVVFEFGTGKLNVKKYTRVKDRTTQANWVQHVIENVPEAAPPFAEDALSRATWGVVDDYAQADITDTTLRQSLVDEHIAVRAYPRETIEFTPDSNFDGRIPVLGVDYDVGDTVYGRAVSDGLQRYNGAFRVWGAKINLDDADVETTTLTVSDQGT